jgi:hypothetical protein
MPVDPGAAPVQPLPAATLEEPARRLLTFLLDLGLFVVTLGVGWIAWSVAEGRRSRTPAMRLLGQQVVGVRTGRPATGGRMAVRQLLGGGLTLLLGFLTCGVGLLFGAWLILSPRRMTLWDRVARTTVVPDAARADAERADGAVPKQRLRPAGRIGRVAGWVTLVPAMLIAVITQGLGLPGAVVSNLITGERADQPSASPANAADFRPTTAECDDVRSPRQIPTTGYEDPEGTLRVFAIQYTIDLADIVDYATWRTTWRCLMEELVEPYRKPGQPTMVVFPEDGGLPTIALGPRGRTVRAQASSPLRAATPAVPLGLAGALGQLNLAYGPQVSAYQLRFGPIDPRKEVFVAATDTFVRAVMVTFSEIARDYGAYVVISNNQASYRETHDPVEVALFADPQVQPTDTAYVATSARVTNSTFLWGPEDVNPEAPDGSENLLFVNEKVPLTPLEELYIGLDNGPSTGPAAVANAGGVDMAGFRVGFATSYPAFTYGYPFGDRPAGFDPCANTAESFAACQDAQGVTLQIQADANPGLWAGVGGLGNWQPLEWTTSVWRAVADPTVGFKYNVTPMMNGNMLDLVFDGQSTITKRGAQQPGRHLVGANVVGPGDSPDMAPYAGDKSEYLVMTDWSGGTGDDREALHAAAVALAPRGDREGEYLQTAIYADLVP